MAEAPASVPGFHRQVVVRIPADDWSLLEDAARQHGSKQAAIIAGLRALRRERDATTTPGPGSRRSLAAESAPPAEARAPHPSGARGSEPTTSDPATRPAGAWWVPQSEAELLLDLDALRRRARDSQA